MPTHHPKPMQEALCVFFKIEKKTNTRDMSNNNADETRRDDALTLDIRDAFRTYNTTKITDIICDQETTILKQRLNNADLYPK